MIPFTRQCCRLAARRIRQQQEMLPVCLESFMAGCRWRNRGVVRHRSLHFMAVLCLLLTWLPAQAANYTFPGNLPAGCSGGSGSYSCGALAIGSGDTISVTVPTTLSINGSLTAGAGSAIHAGGVASDLTLIVMGETTTGANVSIAANLTGTGVVNLGASAAFTGNIKTQSADINIGDNSTVNGSIATTVAGVVNVGANCRVTGSISTLSGAITVGANSRVDGSISSALAGVVTLGAGATAGGNTTTVSGAINIGAGSNVVGFVLNTVAGAITLGDSASVTGGIGTNSGAITLGTGSSAGGSICTGVAGAVTLNANASVAGNVTTNAGAITVGDQSAVGGTLSAVAGAVTVGASSKVGVTASTLLCPLALVYASSVIPPVTVIKSREWRQLFMR